MNKEALLKIIEFLRAGRPGSNIEWNYGLAGGCMFANFHVLFPDNFPDPEGSFCRNYMGLSREETDLLFIPYGLSDECYLEAGMKPIGVDASELELADNIERFINWKESQK